MNESLEKQISDNACPCKHLDEACMEGCTCVDPFSSRGCLYCCTYGSPEQRKYHAEWIKGKLES